MLDIVVYYSTDFVHCCLVFIHQYWPIFTDAQEGKEKLGAHAMKRVAAGAHLPTPWIFEPAERPDDSTDYCLGTS